MIQWIENGNFTPAARNALRFTGLYLLSVRHGFSLPFLISQFGLFLTLVAYFSYRAAWRGLRPFDTTFKKTFATYTDKKKYEESVPLWASIFAGCVNLYCLPDLRKRQAKINAERKEEKNASALILQATAITTDGLVVIADIRQAGEYFSLDVSTKNPDKSCEKEKYQFSSIKALSEFLDSETILRIGDFKSVPH